MYMDIKLFAKNEKELETQIQAVKIYSEDMGMRLSIEKCAIVIMKSRKRQMTEGTEQPNQEKKLELSEKRKFTNTWKYHKRTESNLKKGYFRRTRKRNYIAEIGSKGYIPGLSSSYDTQDHF